MRSTTPERSQRKPRHRAPHAGTIRERILPIAILVSAVLLCFYPVLRAQFIEYDDLDYLVGNRAIQHLDLAHLRHIWTTTMTGNYSPLTIQSFAIEHALFGMNPAVFHATNLLLHAANAVLLYFLCRRLLALGGRSGSWVGPTIAVLFFALHPLRVEPVAWVTARKDTLSLLFYLLSVLAYLDYLTRGGRLRQLGYTFLFFALTVAAKGSAITLPAAMLLLDWKLGRLGRKAILEKAPFIALAILVSVVVLGTQKAGTTGAPDPSRWSESYLVGFYGLAYYAVKTVLPFGIAPFHPYPAEVSIRQPAFLASLLLVPAGLAILIRLARRRPWLAFFSAAALVSIAPALGFIPIAGLALVAARHSYLPAVWLTAGLAMLPLHRRVWPALPLLILLGLLTHRGLADWQDMDRFLSAAKRQFPNSASVLTYAAIHEWRAGKTEEAAEIMTRAVKIEPDRSDLRSQRGMFLTFLGRSDEALEDLNRALALEPRSVSALVNRGYLHSLRGDFVASIRDLDAAIATNPKEDSFYRFRAGVQRQRGKIAEAIDDLGLALELDPFVSENWTLRGECHMQLGKRDLAEQDFNRAIALAPDATAYFLLGEIRLGKGDRARAQQYYRRAMEIDPKLAPAVQARLGEKP